MNPSKEALRAAQELTDLKHAADILSKMIIYWRLNPELQMPAYFKGKLEQCEGNRTVMAAVEVEVEVEVEAVHMQNALKRMGDAA
jgi:hypothetical protein